MTNFVIPITDVKGPKSYIRLILVLALIFPVFSLIGWVTNFQSYGIVNLLVSLLISYLLGLLVMGIVVGVIRFVFYLFSLAEK